MGSPNLVRDGVAVVVVVCVGVVVVTVGVDDEERQRWSVEARVWVRGLLRRGRASFRS